ncbi:hypothetical protein [Sulfurospirillum cavolei]|uniref:hypothetical protein n=1 Tax=Sulfurospirillum cavolei TaxID=366522 RepID=UPI0005A7D991|nr:hypothetical protein [Sulfurospirillum cavolei]
MYDSLWENNAPTIFIISSHLSHIILQTYPKILLKCRRSNAVTIRTCSKSAYLVSNLSPFQE